MYSASRFATRRNENALSTWLAGFSDANCDTFVHRVFTNKAALDATRNTGKDMATGLAAGTAQVASGLSAGLGLFNLVGGTAIDNYNLVLFSDKTFQVVSAAIDAERIRAQAALINGSRRELDEYSYQAALRDLRAYDDTCSLRRALERLGEMADRAKKQAEEDLSKAHRSEIEELRKELEDTRSQRDTTQQLLNQAQAKRLAATDEKEREELTQQVESLLEQVDASNAKIEDLRKSLQAPAAGGGTTDNKPGSSEPSAPQNSTPLPNGG